VRRRAVAVLCGAALLAGCTAQRAGTPVGGTADVEDAHPSYGLPAVPAPPGVAYQPDVVVVPGGAGAVREVSADGLVWTVDAEAVEDLDPGEVMFLTSRATGRVVRVDERGDAAAVTLAPIQLQELIRDGDLDLDVPLDLSAATVQPVPDLPGAAGDPEPGDSDVPLNLRRVAAAPGKLPPAKDKVDVTVGDWSVGGGLDAKGLTLSLAYKPGQVFKGTAELFLAMSRPRVRMGAKIVGGALSGGVSTSLSGITALDVTVAAGVEGGVGDNRKVRLEVPVELLNRPVVVGGVPMVMTIKMKIFIETALSGKNSTLTAHGRWSLDGPVGLTGTTPAKPGFGVVDSIIESIGGIAVGPSGLVLGFEFKFMTGVGIPGASTGPYGKVRASIGITNGSALGAPLARCRRADLVIKGGGGLGLSLGTSVTKAIATTIPGLPPFKAELEAELMGTIVDRTQTLPEVPLCSA
jgi:hypothetical protein